MNKTAIITGASKGIGRQMAKAFAENGYNLLINYNNSKKEAEELCQQLNSKGIIAYAYRADVSDRKQVDSMVEFCIKRFRNIDLLINNAGVAQSILFTDITQDDWKRMIDINLTGVFNCTQSVVKYMISEKKGKIINISSIWGMVGGSCEVHYSTVKAGIIGFTKALAKELGPSNIQVNSIAPGVIQTDMLKGLNDKDLEELKYDTPLMRLGTADDIAECALFLASDKADFITGQVISPNGGFVI